MARKDGRAQTDPRAIEAVPGFHRNAEGSVLYRAGNTVVLCTASVDMGVPAWMIGKGSGWLTAEYQMHPRSSPEKREARDGRSKALSGRTQEIQRLIGRALRAAVDLKALGERTITIDCDVLEADGGTRTASVTGGFLALALAAHRLVRRGDARPFLHSPVAAISVGKIKNDLLLDLVYVEDRDADVDMNVVAMEGDQVIEVQGTAEGAPMSRAELDGMVNLALSGIATLTRMQRSLLAGEGVDLNQLKAQQESV
ncbi:MAG: ribonuclease PH [Polyangiaceae bacterium]|nr:ribonuclease PH [Polyangiaceae bacterium]